MPISWAHYVYGMDRLRLAALREQLRAAQAARHGNAVEDGWTQWQRDQLDLIGD